jgi:uncharacterized membrane protein YfcA
VPGRHDVGHAVPPPVPVSAALIAAGIAVAAGAALQSAVGFGFALVAAPLVFATFAPEEAVGLMVLLALEVNLLTLATERRRPRPLWGDVLPVLAWALPGAVAGVAVLRALDAVALQLLVTAGVLVAVEVHRRAARAAGVRTGVPRWARPATGLVSGALNTSTTTGGPPLVLLLMGRGVPPARVRDTLTATFIGFAGVTVAALALTGTEGAVPSASAAAVLVPLTAAGQLAGRPLFHRLARGRRYESVLSTVLLAAVAVGLLTVLL